MGIASRMRRPPVSEPSALDQLEFAFAAARCAAGKRMSSMPAELEFTGERFVPGVPGEIVYEHVHRYAFARRFAGGGRVLDAACGEGYGSALLAEVAGEVTGVDLDPATIQHARNKYAAARNLRFAEGSTAALPLPAGSVDLVVSFETVEHLPATDQPAMFAEFARVLAPDGLLLVSSPNRTEYTDRRAYRNPFHLHELDREELARLLAERFKASRWFRQRIWLGSMLRAERRVDAVELWEGEAGGVTPAGPHEAMYFVVLAARTESAIPASLPSLSLFSDRGETELSRHAAQASEAIRLDRLASERLAALDRQTGHIRHLERLVAERDAELARRTAQLAESQRAQDAAVEATVEAVRERDRLQRALDANERIVAYRQSIRWWLALPWLRIKLAWVQWRSR